MDLLSRLTRAFTVALFLFVCTAAHAGNCYNVVWSGGTVASPTGSTPYAMIMGQGWGGGYMYTGRNPYVTCTGTITFTYTWEGPDPPPASVVVQEQCNTLAYASSWGGGTITRTADDGFGDASVWDGTFLTCAGTRYSVKSGNSFTVTCTPSAGATLTNGMGQAEATLYYRVALFYPNVRPSGTTTNPADGSANILIGQGCTAAFDPIPNVSLQNYEWTIGGDACEGYECHGRREDNSGLAFARYYPLTPSDLAAASPHWYWRSESGSTGSSLETVTGTADAYVGASKIGTVIASTQIKVWGPVYICTHIARNTTLDIEGTGVFIGAGSSTQDGIEWTGQAVPPALFPAGLGIWSFVQTALCQRFYTMDGVTYHWTDNDLAGLDTSLPYQPDGGDMYADDPNAGWADQNSQHQAGDRPGLPLVPDNLYNLNFSDQFWTYMMYRPADPYLLGHIWVPLHRKAWHWSANVDRPGSSWLMWPSPYPSVLGPVAVTDDARFKLHPLWGCVLFFGLDPFVE